MKALIVDDNHDISELLSIFLKSKGFDTVVINDSKIALEHLKEENYDVTILDVSMPQLSGIDIIRKLERKDILREKKIIILTAAGLSSRQIINLQQKEGIHRCLKKPVRLNELLSAVIN